MPKNIHKDDPSYTGPGYQPDPAAWEPEDIPYRKPLYDLVTNFVIALITIFVVLWVSM